MPLFSYTARDRAGQQHVDVVESATREAAILELRGQGLLPLKISELKKDGGGQKNFSLNPLAYRSINNFDIEHEFHQIAVMLRSGLSLLDALELTIKHCRIGARKTWIRISKRIEQGSTLTEALKEHKIFTEFTTQLIHVGEQTGHLYQVMDQAAEELKAGRKIKKEITTALRYPAFTLLVAVIIVVVMLTTIIPEIKKLLLIMGRPMPPITQALIDTSDWIITNGMLIGIAFVTATAIFIALYNWPVCRWWIDRIALNIPVFGHIFRLAGTVLFARAMGLLLRSGVVILEALETMEKLHINKYLASCVSRAKQRIMQGSSLAEPLELQPCYLPLLIQMIRVGESSGTLDEILIEMTEYHEELLQQAISRMTGMIAPTMTIIVGGIIGFVYAAFLVAMFSAAGGSPS